MLVALSLTRELGPVVAAAAVRGRLASAVTAEIGLMKTTRQLTANGHDGRQSDRGWVAPRFWGRDLDADPGSLVLGDGILGGWWLIRVPSSASMTVPSGRRYRQRLIFATTY